MRGPQLEHGYTRIANEILEIVSQSKFNGTQFKIIMAIWRYTYGFNRKDSGFSLNFLSEAIKSNRNQVKRELDKLIEDKVILITREADFNNSRRLAFNKNYLEWNVKGTQYLEKSTVPQLEYGTVLGLEYGTVLGLEYQERKIKDNIKKDTITTIEDPEENFEPDNLVADIGAGPIQQDKSVAQVDADFTKQTRSVSDIERYYLKLRGIVTCSGKEFKDMLDAYNRYKDINFILDTMKIASKRNIEREGRLTISSFKYFIPIFEDEWKRRQAEKEAEKVEPITRNSKPNNGFDKSQFLWNG